MLSPKFEVKWWSPNRLARLTIMALFFGLVIPIAHADTDPFPGVAHMGEIPGTRVSSTAGQSQSAWEATDAYKNRPACTSGSGSGVEVGAGVYSIYCVKTWQPQATIDVEEDFRNRQNLAIAQATIESQQYSAANPGLQKCVTWGPVVHANGVSTASGGVCANVVGTKPDGSTQQVAPTQVATTPTTSTSTTSTETKTSITSMSDSLTSTANPVINNAQDSIALNKVRAIALNKSQQTANLNPGTIWCVPWSFNNQSGQECSYQPNQSDNPFGPRATTITVPTVIPSKTLQLDSSDTATATSTSANPSNSDTKTATVVLETSIDSTTANAGQDFGGTVAQVKQAVSSMVEDTATALAINTVLQKVSNLSNKTIKASKKLPSTQDLEVLAISKTNSTCVVLNNKIRVKKTGTCELEYSVTDEEDNTFSINAIIKVKKAKK